MADRLFGLDSLREWLASQGFRVAPDPLGSRDNGCDWYAWRRSALPARECECNDGKPAQIVVRPFDLRLPSHRVQSVAVEVCGEAGGAWYRLQAYSIPVDELAERLSAIEASLIAAWNALLPKETGK